MSRVVATWQENGMQYTLTASPIGTEVDNNGKELISIFDYLGNKTPDRGTGESVYKHAIAVGAKVDSKQVVTKNYTGKVMLYERAFLDSYFDALATETYTPKPMNTPARNTVAYEDDDLPF